MESNAEFVKRVLIYCKQALPGPWHWKSNKDAGKGTFDLLYERQPELSFGILGDADFEGSRFGGIVSMTAIANQNFIAIARTDLPDACTRLEATEGKIKHCPECNSDEVEMIVDKATFDGELYVYVPVWKCKKCPFGWTDDVGAEVWTQNKARIERLEEDLADEKADREIEKTVDSEAVLGLREENKQQQKEIHKAYMDGRAKGFSDGKRNADELQAKIEQQQEEIRALKKFQSNRVDKKVMDEAIKLATKQLQARIEQQRWIPVSERLPENIATVLVFTGEGVGGIGFYSPDEKCWERLDHAINLNITHWKPIILPAEELL